MSFLVELRKRKVYQVGLAYLALAWLLVQVAATLFPAFELPAWTLRFVILLLALGFPIALLMAWALELTPDGLKVDVPAQGGRPMLAIAAGLIVVALVWFFGGERLPAPPVPPPAAVTATAPTPTPASTPAPEPAPAATDHRAIAVLPLVNASSDPEQQFFSDGLSENLIDALSRFDGLKVIGRLSAFRFRDSADDSASIGRQLGVAYLLNGSVQRVGGDVRIRVSLTQAADGRTLWSEHYDRPYDNLFSLQDEIARAVADALRVKLLAPAGRAGNDDRPPGGDIAAYDAYLRGLKHWYDQDFGQAAEHMAEAVRLDPDYALAWARLSESLSTAATFGAGSAAVAARQMRESRVAGETALRLAPELGPAHTARASLAFYSFDFAGARAECERAVPLAPDDGMVLNSCGYTLAGIGQLGEAMRLRERLLAIEPLYDVNHYEYAELLMASGRLDEAEKYLRIAEGLSAPDAWRRLLLALLRDDAETAMAVARQVPAERRPRYLALAAQMAPGPAADRALDDVLADAGDADPRSYGIAQAYALRGDAANAVQWLERAPIGDLLFVLSDPVMLQLRDDPLFTAFCARAGISAPGESGALNVDQVRALASKRQ